jgi:dTDP-4-dehydrorhamnose reductase
MELAAVFSGRSCEVAAFDRLSVDITSGESVLRAIENYHPEVVVNAAAYNKVDLAEEEPDAAMQVNALAVRNLALACHRVGAKLVHFSTDYVFDGSSVEPYRETDTPGPLSAYAVSKFGGELYAQAYLADALILRTCGVFGPHGSHTTGGNFVETMLRLAESGRPLRVVEDFIASPTYAPALAERTAALVEAGASGVFHAGGGEPISWHAWAARIFAAFGVAANLKPTNQQEYPTRARRPQYSVLSNAKMEALRIAPMPSLDQALRDYVAKRKA